MLQIVQNRNFSTYRVQRRRIIAVRVRALQRRFPDRFARKVDIVIVAVTSVLRIPRRISIPTSTHFPDRSIRTGADNRSHLVPWFFVYWS